MTVRPPNKRFHRLCRACHRPLSSSTAMRRGFGSGCSRKFKGLIARERLEQQGQMRLFK